MASAVESQVSKLEALQRCYGPGCSVRVEKLLRVLDRLKFAGAESLVRFHDALLFLRAFPQSRGVCELSEKLLGQVASHVVALQRSGADMEIFDSEHYSGIAGTTVNDTFTFEVARWLAGMYPNAVRVDWDLDEQSRQMSVSLPRFLPLLADDSLVEADTPYLEWLSKAAGGRDRILAWLLQRLEDSPLTMLQRTEWYDALKIRLFWSLGDSEASRTRARHIPSRIFCHRQPLIRRNQVSLADELKSPPLPVRKLGRRAAEKLLNLVRNVLTVRYRELYGTTRGDANQVVEADLGRGVQIFLWGLPPDRRLPLRTYHAGLTVKNGVPINYIEGISLFDWMEVGFNTFYAFRDGETAWIYSKVLHLLYQVAAVRCFSVYPYQLGHDNEEAISSGAFWFYRKLGFSPGRPELLKLTRQEEAKMMRHPGHRTSARTLRELAAEHVFYELGEGPHGLWTGFSTRKIGLAVQRRAAEEFDGDPKAMERTASAMLAELLGVKPRNWRALEQSVFENFALVLSLVPEIQGWTDGQKRDLVKIIRAKVWPDETGYLHLMQEHGPLKQAFLKLGTTPTNPRSDQRQRA